MRYSASVQRDDPCPVPECTDRPWNNCTYCPAHQRIVNEFQWHMIDAEWSDFTSPA